MEVKFRFKFSLKGQNNEGTWNRICGEDRLSERERQKKRMFLLERKLTHFFFLAFLYFTAFLKGIIILVFKAKTKFKKRVTKVIIQVSSYVHELARSPRVVDF